MARSAVKLPRCRWFLCNFHFSFARRCPPWIAEESRALDVSAASDCHGGFKFHRSGWIPGVTFDSVRFRQLHQSLASASILYVGPIIERRADPIRVIICL